MASEDENCIFLNDDGIVKEGFVRDTPYLRQILEIPEVEIETEPAELEQSQEVEDVLVEKHSEVEEHWDEATAKHLLTLYLQNVDKFKNPRVKKKLLWKKIGAVLGKDASVCDKKYRNLKQHYTTLLKKNKKFHKRPIRWPFFSLFEQINSKEGFKLEEPLRYRPIAQKPDWTTPQLLVVSNGSNVKAPVIVNPISPVNNGINLNTISVCDVPDSGAQHNSKEGEFLSISEELRERQKNIELKLDRLVEVVEESNNIQRERNKLFQEYLKTISGI